MTNQLHTRPLLAVVGLIGSTVVSMGQTNHDPEDFFPIELTCPTKENPTLVLLEENFLGERARYAFSYFRGQAVELKLDAADARKPLELFHRLKKFDSDPLDAQLFDVFYSAKAPRFEKACTDGGSELRRVWQEMQNNKLRLQEVVDKN